MLVLAHRLLDIDDLDVFSHQFGLGIVVDKITDTGSLILRHDLGGVDDGDGDLNVPDGICEPRFGAGDVELISYLMDDGLSHHPFVLE